MQTEALIRELAAKAEPIAEGTVVRRLTVAFSLGMVLAVILQNQTVGFREDSGSALFAVLWKIAFCVGLSLIWLRYLRSLSVPGSDHHTPSIVAAFGLVLVGATAIFSPLDIAALQSCVSQVLLLAAPALAALLWVVHKAAPLQPGTAGFATGIAAGAIGAFAYSLGCVADAPAVVAMRYGTAILLSGVIGSVLGRFLLRW